jgi:hypothetical protein
VELTNEEGNVAYTGLMGKAGFSDKVECMFERVADPDLKLSRESVFENFPNRGSVFRCSLSV